MIATSLHASPLNSTSLSPPSPASSFSTYNTHQPPSSPFSSSTISVPKLEINNAKCPSPFFLCCIFCLWEALSLVTAQEDPELQQCKHQCRAQQQVSERQRRECEQTCEDYYREHHEPVVDPEKQLQQCRKQCELLQPGRLRKHCHRECQQKYDQEQLGRGGEEEEEDDPYVFRTDILLSSGPLKPTLKHSWFQPTMMARSLASSPRVHLFLSSSYHVDHHS